MKKKIKLEIIIPVIVAIIIVAIFVYLDYIKEKQEIRPEIPWSVTTKPVSKVENPRRSEELVREESDYGCGGPGSVNLTVVKEPDSIWSISKKEKIVSLGRYRITPPKYTVLDIEKLWVYFTSNALSNRDDKWYGLEKSYVSGMILRVNGYDREIKLGGDDYMLIELKDYPLGDYYPYKDMDLEFEFLIKLKRSDESLSRINGADVQAQIRLFLIGCQEFTQDIVANANLKYGD